MQSVPMACNRSVIIRFMNKAESVASDIRMFSHCALFTRLYCSGSYSKRNDEMRNLMHNEITQDTRVAHRGQAGNR